MPAILFYDGHCALCNGSVKFLLPRDKEGKIRYAPLQGDTAREAMERGEVPVGADSVVLLTDQGVFLQSDAVLKSLELLPPPWKWLAVGRVVPRRIRDGIYRWVAQRRYAWFGRYETCPLPPQKWRGRFMK